MSFSTFCLVDHEDIGTIMAFKIKMDDYHRIVQESTAMLVALLWHSGALSYMLTCSHRQCWHADV